MAHHISRFWQTYERVKKVLTAAGITLPEKPDTLIRTIIKKGDGYTAIEQAPDSQIIDLYNQSKRKKPGRKPGRQARVPTHTKGDTRGGTNGQTNHNLQNLILLEGRLDQVLHEANGSSETVKEAIRDARRVVSTEVLVGKQLVS